MWQYVVVGGIAAAAAGWLGWWLYRSLTGKAGCACGAQADCPLKRSRPPGQAKDAPTRGERGGANAA